MPTATVQSTLFSTRRRTPYAHQRIVKILDAVYALRLATPLQIATLHPSPQPKSPLPTGQFRGGLTAIKAVMRQLSKEGLLRRADKIDIYSLAREGDAL